jgi:predicted glycogen debranching enzyme
MTNLEESLHREFLRTNRSGAYSASTLVDCNTRKYHGLLVVPVPELDDENHVLLSSLDCTVIQHGAEFNLGLHKYQGNNFSPKGHKYIREYDCDVVPTTIYRVGGVLLKKEVVFHHYEDRILIRYTLEDAHSATTLRFRPFLAFRSVRQFTHENSTASREYHEVDNGIKTCMYAGYPDLYMQFSKKNEFIFQPDWYRGVEYPKEQERGYASNEDLYVPGYFEMPIKKGESIIFSGSISPIKTSTLKKLFDEEVEEQVEGLSELMVKDMYIVSTLDKLEKLCPSIYKVFNSRKVQAILIVRVGMGDETYGYLVCAEPRSQRIWQEDECGIMYFLARHLAAHRHFSG